MCAVCKRCHPTSLHEAILERIKEREAEKTVTLYKRSTAEDNITSDKVSEDPKSDIVSNKSDACFIKESILNKFGTKGHNVHLKLATVLEETVERLLVGLTCMRAIKPRELILGKDDEPYARKTLLGWSIIGRVIDKCQDDVTDQALASELMVHKVTINGEKKCGFLSSQTKVKEIINPAQLSKFFELDFNEWKIGDIPCSHQDRIFLRKMKEGIHQQEDGHVCYIPHHGVYHPKKPGKIRVIFDCSATYKNESLNKNLLQGPDLTNNLIGVLCRFRKYYVAVVCDIEAMFHQVKVRPNHRNLLRFLWWNNGDLYSNLMEYRMTVHLFGATSSPSVANFALKATADDYKGPKGSKAATFVTNEFYVDDGLTSVPTVAEAISLIKDSKALCQSGGFKLHKFLSNHKEVLETTNSDERASIKKK
ncbi:uncharacterized protein LOC122244267 [Penaeus japonicus]|uniref:uncharacterized protein LOC122244267 n=1 Tax=Penaeus japonicus TaxID=27405 RepID=UPI001C70FF67|nr:uncharacterized protein LOC122244267 [Penaeus japonicus]